jgi:hypothetical protein
LIESVSEIVVQNFNTSDNIFCLLRIVHRILKQILEPLQRVLVHIVDIVEVNDAEEEELGAESNSSETLTFHINLLLSHLRFGLAYGNLP